MTLIDFTRVHPRTLLWWQQREQCKRCAHALIEDIAGYTLMHCELASHRNRDRTCATARDPGEPCGPDGRLFTPKH